MCVFGYGDEAILMKDTALIFKKHIFEDRR